MKEGSRNLKGRSVSLQLGAPRFSYSLLACLILYCPRWHHLSLCSVGCTWPLLHLMVFFQVQLPLLTASFKRMRSFSQCQAWTMKVFYRLAQLIVWYQSGNIIQAAWHCVQQARAGIKRSCVYWGWERVEDRKVHPFGTNHSCLKACPFSKQQ